MFGKGRDLHLNTSKHESSHTDVWCVDSRKHLRKNNANSSYFVPEKRSKEKKLSIHSMEPGFAKTK